MKFFSKTFIAMGLGVLMAACVSPSGPPTNLGEPPPNISGGQENTAIIPPGAGQEAAPSWTASSSGSVGCLAGSFFVHVSLDDQGPMDPQALSFTVTAKGPSQEGYTPLADHGLTILNIQVRDLNGTLFTTSPGEVSLNPNLASSLNTPPALRGLLPPGSQPAVKDPTELNAWINLWSPDNRLPCEQFWNQVLLQKSFSLLGTYPSGPLAYEKVQEPLSLTLPGQGVTSVDPFILLKKE